MSIVREDRGPVTVLRIDRPETRGALALADWEELAGDVRAVAADDAVRVVVLTGTGSQFCAGANIADIAENRRAPGWAARKYDAVRACNHGLATMAKPVIAAVTGDAIGGGCGLALACDIRLAAPAARFGVTPAKLGIAYARYDTGLLVRAVGAAEASRLLLIAAIIGAQEALRIGLIHAIEPDPLAAALAMAEGIAALSPHSLAHAKQQIARVAAGETDDDPHSRAAFIEAYAREELGERAAGFLKKG